MLLHTTQKRTCDALSRSSASAAQRSIDHGRVKNIPQSSMHEPYYITHAQQKANMINFNAGTNACLAQHHHTIQQVELMFCIIESRAMSCLSLPLFDRPSLARKCAQGRGPCQP